MLRGYIFFLMALLAYLPASAQTSPPVPYLILISFDGFRWDYPNRGITPNMAYMRENGATALSLEPCFPSKTFPNHIATVTGLYPQNHGLIFNTVTNPYTGERFSLSNRDAVRDGKWYWGEFFWETAERQGILTASYFWPGSGILQESRHPTYREFYEHDRPFETRVQGVLDWLQLPEEKRPHFITLYFDEPDSKGHDFGPDSPEVNETIRRMDAILGMLMDGLRKLNLFEQTNIIITSDHGMTNVDTERIIDVAALLNGFDCKFYEIGPVMMVEPSRDSVAAVYQTLKGKAQHFSVYRREEVPPYYHFSQNPFVAPIVLVAEMGWSLHTTRSAARYRQQHTTGGNHGYDNHHLDMHGVFYAMGPAFKRGYRTGTVRNIDIYPLLCKIFGIFPRQNIDGDLTRIAFVLREE